MRPREHFRSLGQEGFARHQCEPSFEEAVHSLNAAVHLLTARAVGAGWRVA